ncbi:PQQ-like beta-propeller repeat protein, partial [archaeon]|nr:PQQ-like beta-propeller repeat protein [archaeon]
MRKTGVILIVIVLSLFVSCIPSSSGADWPMFRNDTMHSGTSNATGNFSGVKCLWRYDTGSWIISSPSVADIDNDGEKEIVFGSGDGKIHVLNNNGTEKWNKIVGYADYDITSSPTLYNNDTEMEIVVTTWDKVYVFNSTGKEIWNYTVDVDISNWTAYPLTTAPLIQSSPIVTDLNNDNISEIIIASWNGDVYVLGNEGFLPWNRTFYTYILGGCDPIGGYRDSICSTPSVADLDNDSSSEIIFQTMSGNLTVLHSNGTTFWYYPITWYEQTKPQLCQGVSSPLIHDITMDGKPEVIIGSQDGYLYVFSWNGTLLWKFYADGSI